MLKASKEPFLVNSTCWISISVSERNCSDWLVSKRISVEEEKNESDLFVYFYPLEQSTSSVMNTIISLWATDVLAS